MMIRSRCPAGDICQVELDGFVVGWSKQRSNMLKTWLLRLLAFELILTSIWFERVETSELLPLLFFSASASNLCWIPPKSCIKSCRSNAAMHLGGQEFTGDFEACSEPTSLLTPDPVIAFQWSLISTQCRPPPPPHHHHHHPHPHPHHHHHHHLQSQSVQRKTVNSF